MHREYREYRRRCWKEWNKKCLTGGKTTTTKKKKKKWFWSVEQAMNAVCNFFRFLSLYAHTCWIANSLSRSMQFPPSPPSLFFFFLNFFLWPWLRLLQCSKNFIRVFLLSDEDDDFINFGWQFLLLFHLHIPAAVACLCVALIEFLNVPFLKRNAFLSDL